MKTVPSPDRRNERGRGRRRAGSLGVVGLALAQALSGPAAAEPSRQPRCGLPGAVATAARAAVPEGTLLTAQQDPAAVPFGYRGRLRYRDLAVLGDFESVGFRIDSFGGTRTFTAERRTSFVNAQGDVISLFDIEGTLEEWVVLPFNWDVDVAAPLLFSDLLYLGPPGNERPFYLPIMVLPKKLPRSRVVRRGSRLQYASNVVNVAVPDLHRRQLDEPTSLGFSPEEVTDLLAERLGGFDYDEIGFGLWQHHLTNPGAFHQNNTGSPYPPYSLYSSAAIPHFGLWKHEIGHNWNFRYDLPHLVGWSAPFDGFHSRGTVAPEAGLLCCGAYPVRRVDGKWRTVWIPEPHPYHPLELFAMGLLEPEQVPEMRVFKRQDLRDFRPGEVMRGPSRPLDVAAVIEEYGMPEPAAQDFWHVAPVVVSRKLLPRRTLSALNFYMRRIEDPDGNAPESFDRSTAGLMDLRTTIVVSSGPRPRPPRKVAFPTIGRMEVPGVLLDRPLPGCVAPGSPVIVSGRTVSGDDPEAIVLVPSNPATPPVEAHSQPAGDGTFDVTLVPEAEEVHRLRIGPIWPRQEPGDVTIGPIHVRTDCPGG